MASISTFSISLLVILVLLLSKWREQVSGSKNFVGNLLSRLDSRASKIISFFDFKRRQITQTIKYVILIVIPGRTEESFREAKRAVLGQYQKQKEILMGRKDIGNGASASFYLKKIREEQEGMKPGRIEDNG